MQGQKAFGRRAVAQPPSRNMRLPAALVVQVSSMTTAEAQAEWIATPSITDLSTHDQELEDWRRNRKFQIPWRQLSFMASLCFGIASFVLPGSVNSKVDWLLYALMAVSFAVGISRRRKAKTEGVKAL